MQQDIFDFLKKLETEGKILPEVRHQVQNEIEKYEGMRLVLGNGTTQNAFSENLLGNIDRYLHDLRLVKQKLSVTFLSLVKCSPDENPELNRSLLAILRKLNRK